MQTFLFDAHTYPAAGKAVTFTLRKPAAETNGSDLLYVGAVPVYSTDVILFRDGAYVQTGITNAITQDTAGGCDAVYKLTLTQAEMSTAEVIDLLIHDADGVTFRDAHIQIRTKLKLGQIDVDATGIGGNTHAFILTSAGTGSSLYCYDDITIAGTETLTIGGNMAIGGDLDIAGKLDVVGNIETDAAFAIGTNFTVAGAMTITGILSAASIGGVLTSMVLRKATAQGAGTGNNQIQLDASANTTNDYYNNQIVMIVSGTGAGQSRVITDYVGSTTLTATVNRDWVTNPAADSVFMIMPGSDVWSFGPTAELTGIPAFGTAGYGDLIQALFQRFFFKRTQTASTFTMFKSNSTTALGTASVDDDGTTQTSGKVSTA